MGYIRTVSSLQEKASLQVALNLCQDISFMAAALCLERPTYGFFDCEAHPSFVSSSRKMLLGNDASNDSSMFFGFTECASTREQDIKPSFVTDARILSLWEMSNEYSSPSHCDKNWVGNWFAAVDEQCQKLMENLPQSLKFRIRSWMDRIALEYISYCHRLQVSFGLPRYFSVNFLTRGDWMETCRLDEKKLAKRLLRDTRLTYLQRYRIACVYCRFDDIPPLWKKLSEKEKEDIFENKEPTMPQAASSLVEMWSFDWDADEDPEVIQRSKIPWPDVLSALVAYGNVELVKPIWKELEEEIRQDLVIDWAVMSVKYWYVFNFDRFFYCCKENFIWNDVTPSFKNTNLMSYYSELILFFLTEMNEDQQLAFFQRAFEEYNILICFLYWPLCDYFFQIINQLWEILPVEEYRDCLFLLASLCGEKSDIRLTFDYSENYGFYCDFLNGKISEFFSWGKIYENYCESQYRKINQNYDYRSLLHKVWEATPLAYKPHLFFRPHEKFQYAINGVERSLLTQMLKKSPFQKNDEALFKLIFGDLPESDRRVMIRDREGLEICSMLLEKDKLTFVDWFLRQCVKEDEIPRYTKEFVTSKMGRKLCIFKLHENR